jgi:acetoin utilization protein AcuB
MLVGNRMTVRPVTIRGSASIDQALELMREEKVRRLPVLNKGGDLVGIISELDLLKASPSPATSLSIYEIPYILAKIKIKSIMTTDVITVAEDTPLEEAARIMVDNKIGGLPVMRDGKLVGIITETDVFKVFLEVLGARKPGVRVSIMVPDEKGMLGRITTKVAEMGGDILSLGTTMGEDPTSGQVTFRVSDLEEGTLVAALQELGVKVLDARFCPSAECPE